MNRVSTKSITFVFVAVLIFAVLFAVFSVDILFLGDTYDTVAVADTTSTQKTTDVASLALSSSGVNLSDVYGAVESGTVLEGYSYSSGTAISTAAGLYSWLVTNKGSAYLTNNITVDLTDLSDNTNWKGDAVRNLASGQVFDGNGYTITFTESATTSLSDTNSTNKTRTSFLFHNVYGTVQNLSVIYDTTSTSNVTYTITNMKASSSENIQWGGITAYLSGTINNVYVEVSENVTIELESASDTSGIYAIGGIAGSTATNASSGGVVTNSTVNIQGTITTSTAAEQTYMGGINGEYASVSPINNCAVIMQEYAFVSNATTTSWIGAIVSNCTTTGSSSLGYIILDVHKSFYSYKSNTTKHVGLLSSGGSGTPTYTKLYLLQANTTTYNASSGSATNVYSYSTPTISVTNGYSSITTATNIVNDSSAFGEFMIYAGGTNVLTSITGGTSGSWTRFSSAVSYDLVYTGTFTLSDIINQSVSYTVNSEAVANTPSTSGYDKSVTMAYSAEFSSSDILLSSYTNSDVLSELNAGTLVIKYSGTGSTTYAESPTVPTSVGTYSAQCEITCGGITYISVAYSFEITTAKITIGLESGQSISQEYGSAVPDFELTLISGGGDLLTGDKLDSIGLSLTYEATITIDKDTTNYTLSSATNVGTYTISIMSAEASGYKITCEDTTATLEITAASVAVENLTAEVDYGSSDITYSYDSVCNANNEDLSPNSYKISVTYDEDSDYSVGASVAVYEAKFTCTIIDSSGNYKSSVEVPGTLTINMVTPSVYDSNNEVLDSDSYTIEYGQSASDALSNISATVSAYYCGALTKIAGTLSFVDVKGNKDVSETAYELTLEFKPTDSTNYNGFTIDIDLTVVAATVNISNLKIEYTYGQSIETLLEEINDAESEFSGTLFTATTVNANDSSLTVSGSWAFSTTGILGADTYDNGGYTFTFTPISTNYQVTDTKTYTITVNPYVIYLKDIVNSLDADARTITYGTTLANLSLTSLTNSYSGIEIAGSYLWYSSVDVDEDVADSIIGATTDTGTTYYLWFELTDTTNYSIYDGSDSSDSGDSNYGSDGRYACTIIVNKSVQAISYETDLQTDTTYNYQVADTVKTVTIKASTDAKYTTNGTISAASSDVSKITVTIDVNGEITLTIVDNVSGAVTITLNNAGDGNYSAAPSVTITIVIKASVSWASGATSIDGTYGDTATYSPVLESSEGSYYAGDYTITSSNEDIISVALVVDSEDSKKNYYSLSFNRVTSNATLTISYAGTGTVVAYTETISVTITAAELTIVVENITVTYGDTPTFTYKAYTNYGTETEEEELENYGDVISINDNSYDSDATYSVQDGGYSIIVTSAANTSGNLNYSFIYVAGTMTVIPKELTATLSSTSDTITYGEDIPTLSILYSGWVGDDSVDNSSSFEEPTIKLGDFAQYSNVGTYTISLTGGSATNYYFNIVDDIICDSSIAITVVASDATISLAKASTSYSGLAQEVEATVSGFDEDEMAGSVSYLYSSDGANYYETAINVGTYYVKVTYTNDSKDANYNAETTKEFDDYLVITAVDPTIDVSGISNLVYTGIEITPTVTVTGLGGNSTAPIGKYTTAYSATPKDAGNYTVTITYTADALNDNYSSYIYTESFTIAQATLTVALESKTTTYASASSIFADVVTANTATVTGVNDESTATIIVTYLYYIDGEWTTSAPSNAGSYNVKVIYDASEMPNYASNEKEFTDAVVIEKADIADNIKLSETAYSYTYGTDVSEYIYATATGIVGGSDTKGSFTYMYQVLGETAELDIAEEVGAYNIIITYGTDDNYYASYTVCIMNVLTITAISPIISLPTYTFSYTGNTAVITANVLAQGTGSTPAGTVSYEYVLADYTISEDTYSNMAWSSSAPIDAGVYFVRVTYTAANNDNYETISEIYTDRLTINAVKPTVSLTTVTTTYTGEGVEAKATATGLGEDMLYGTLSYYYANVLTSSVWTSETPSASGTYNVRVIFTPSVEDTNYAEEDKYYSNAVVINNISPTLSITNIETIYSGASVGIGNITITNSSDSGDALGKFTTEYQVSTGGSWSTSSPSNAGTYNVRITYTAASVDNFSSTVATFSGAVTINAKDIVVTPVSSQTKEYDGTMIDGAAIDYLADGLISGNSWSGSLSATTATGVGAYEISLGSLYVAITGASGSNYNIIFTSGYTYSITQKELIISFSTITSTYDGNAKFVEVTLDQSSVIAGETVAIASSISGDNVNVGSFTVVASLVEEGDYANYSMPSVTATSYTIAAATMYYNVFENASYSYDGTVHTLEMNSVEEGATVTYDVATSYISRGSYTVTATVTKENYETVRLTATLIISKGDAVVESVTAAESSYIYGDSLPSLVATGTEGTAVLDDGQTLIPGTLYYTYTFIPTDTYNYNSVTGTVAITVEKASVDITISGNLNQTISSPNNLSVSVSGYDAESGLTATVYYINDMTGEITTTMPKEAGTYTVQVVYSGNEYFDATTYTNKLVISSESNLTWLWYALGAFVILIAASAVYFSRTRAEYRQ